MSCVSAQDTNWYTVWSTVRYCILGAGRLSPYKITAVSSSIHNGTSGKLTQCVVLTLLLMSDLVLSPGKKSLLEDA
jgi:hypothetical protein